MKVCRWLQSGLLILSTNLAVTAQAGTMGCTGQCMPSNWFVGAQVGAFWPSFTDTVTVNNGAPYVAPYNHDQYSTNKETAVPVGFMGGYEWRRQEAWFPAISLALQYQHFFSQTVSGVITQYSLPQFANYDYSVDVSSDFLGFYSQLDLYQYDDLAPFVDVGIGVARNSTSKFRETARDGVTPRISPAFTSNSENNVAFNLGIGLKYYVTAQLAATLGYDYQYLGDLKTGLGVTTWSREHLDLGNYKGNRLTFGVTYHFDNAGTSGSYGK